MTSEPAVADSPGRVAASFTSADVVPHRCFACGALNEHGMHLVLHVEGDLAWTELALEDRFAGWEGIGHGGIVATILDEVMAWSLATADAWGMTARMAVEFKRPVPTGAPLRAEARITRQRRRVVETEGRLVHRDDGTVLATATGTYVAADPAAQAELRARYGFPIPLGATR